MIKHLIKVENKLVITKAYHQDKLARCKGSKEHNATSGGVQMALITNLIILLGKPEKEHRAWHITKLLPLPTKGEGWDVPAQPFSISYVIGEGRWRGVSKGKRQIVHGADVLSYQSLGSGCIVGL
jgi:hypothetical protein